MRLIDGDALKEVIFSKTNGMEDLWDTAGILNAINNAPTVYPICEDKVCKYRANERPQGEWLEGIYPVECSFCHAYPPFNDNGFYKTNYCPNCGAKMKGGAE